MLKMPIAKKWKSDKTIDGISSKYLKKFFFSFIKEKKKLSLKSERFTGEL